MSGFLGKHCMSGFLRKRFVLLPFANKNVFEENLTYNKVVCLEVFITKQGVLVQILSKIFEKFLFLY